MEVVVIEDPITLEEANKLQEEYLQDRINDNIDDTLILFRPSDSYYTVGHRFHEDYERFVRDPKQELPGRVILVDRGGKMTWHGKGQVMGYQIAKIEGGNPRPQNARLEEGVRRVINPILGEFGVQVASLWNTERRDPVEGKNIQGLWTDEAFQRKVMAIGIRIIQANKNHYIKHGFALNTNLTQKDIDYYFGRIQACGYEEPITASLKELMRGRDVDEIDLMLKIKRELGK